MNKPQSHGLFARTWTSRRPWKTGLSFLCLLFVLLLPLTIRAAHGVRYELPGPQGSIVLDSVEIRSVEYFDVLSFVKQTGMSFDWQPALERLEITSPRGDQVVLIIGLETYKFNNQIARMAPPVRDEGRVLVNSETLERVASTLGIGLHWEQREVAQSTPTEKELTLDELLALLSSGTPTPAAATGELVTPTPTEIDMPFGLKGGTSEDFAEMIEEAKKELKAEKGERMLRQGTYLTRIVLDPAYGGSDPGGIGPTGIHEAEICWQICQLLKERFQQGTNVEVFMTRDGNEKEPVSNAMRAARANAVQGELLISVHCGTGLFPEQSGIDVFYPQEEERDPLQPEIEVLSEDLDDSGERIVKKLVVWKQAGMPYQRQSLILANSLNESLQVMSSPDREMVPRAAYLELLQSVQMPSALIEVGVISNPEEETRLRQKGYQREIAESIYAGIVNYLRERE